MKLIIKNMFYKLCINNIKKKNSLLFGGKFKKIVQ